MAYDSVFKRVEKKYRTTPRQRAAVEAAARDTGAMAVDVYGRTRITSLYLDTPERAMIARSVEKPLYKEKLRLRAYGEAAGTALMAAFGAGPLVRNADRPPLSDAEVEARAAAVPGGEATAVFFGIKKKFKGIVYKRPTSGLACAGRLPMPSRPLQPLPPPPVRSPGSWRPPWTAGCLLRLPWALPATARRGVCAAHSRGSPRRPVSRRATRLRLAFLQRRTA